MFSINFIAKRDLKKVNLSRLYFEMYALQIIKILNKTKTERSNARMFFC